MNILLRGHPSLLVGEVDDYHDIISVTRSPARLHHTHTSTRAEISYTNCVGRYDYTYVHAQETIELRPRFRE